MKCQKICRGTISWSSRYETALSIAPLNFFAHWRAFRYTVKHSCAVGPKLWVSLERRTFGHQHHLCTHSVIVTQYVPLVLVMFNQYWKEKNLNRIPSAFAHIMSFSRENIVSNGRCERSGRTLVLVMNRHLEQLAGRVISNMENWSWATLAYHPESKISSRMSCKISANDASFSISSRFWTSIR